MEQSGKSLGMYCGDTEYLTWAKVDSSDVIIPFETGDVVHFALWADGTTNTPTLSKECTVFTVAGEAKFDFESVDTRDIAPGDYKYSLWAVYANGDEQTAIGRLSFTLRKR